MVRRAGFSTWSEYKGEIETLKLLKDPWRCGLGHYKDADGDLWDIHAIVGKCVNARKIQGVGQNGYYGTGTDDFAGPTQYYNPVHKWPPYYVEVVSLDK
jgi:hypothetical protein